MEFRLGQMRKALAQALLKKSLSEGRHFKCLLQALRWCHAAQDLQVGLMVGARFGVHSIFRGRRDGVGKAYRQYSRRWPENQPPA